MRPILFLVALGAALLGAVVVWMADRASPAPGSRGAIEQIVRDYVLSHPELIPEAMAKLQNRQSMDAIASNRDRIVTPIGNAWAGNPKGDVTVVEYYDYNCGYCRAMLPTIDALIKADSNVRVVYQELPVLSAESGTAAKLSIAAAKAGRFMAFHQAMYAGGPISDESMDAAARTAGLDPKALRRAAEAPDVAAAVRANLALMQPLGMSGTPTWVIGNRVLSGAMSLGEMRKAVNEARGS